MKKSKQPKAPLNATPKAPPPKATDWIIPVILIVAGLLAYSNSFKGPLIFDDLESTTSNPHIKHLWPLTEAMSAVPQTATAGRPIPSLSLAVNYAFGGFDVTGYHAM